MKPQTVSYPPGSHLKQADDVSSVLSLKYEGILSYIYLAFLLVALSQLIFHIVLKTSLKHIVWRDGDYTTSAESSYLYLLQFTHLNLIFSARGLPISKTVSASWPLILRSSLMK